MFELIKEDGYARVGRLKTQHGTIETPFFMPVATKMSLKLVDVKDISDMGIKSIIANSFLIYLNPGLELIERIGIHRFMNFNDVIFTDSGGFQMISSGFLVKSSDKGVRLRSPYNGEIHLLTPEKAIQIQNIIKSDVAMCLDELPSHGTDYNSVASSLKRTHMWAERCKKSFKEDKQLLFGIVQGSVFNELREKSCKFISSLDFDGIALGGLSIGESKKEMYNIIKKCSNLLPENKPRYLMGVGSPEDILIAIENGVDIFDSCYPTRIARRENLFTENGKIRIDKREFKEDFNAIEEDCDCYTCKNFTKAYLHHLIKIKEPLGLRLMTLHNLRFIQRLIENVKISIKENRFKEFKREFLKRYLG